jgi:2-phospho-L-lactate guanylyltransferase
MSASGNLWAVVPVKLFADTKRRLMPVLESDERAALARTMLEDVLSVLTRTSSLGGIMVITPDAAAAAIAHAAGALVVDDLENTGTSAAVAQASRHLAAARCGDMLMVAADVPSITPADIETVVAAHRAAPSVTLVGATIDGGTNALACSPPGVMPFCFGDDSLRRHREAARAAGIEPAVLRIERLSNDIDRPADLADFLRKPSLTRTYAYLTAGGLADRIRCIPETMQGISRRSLSAGSTEEVTNP